VRARSYSLSKISVTRVHSSEAVLDKSSIMEELIRKGRKTAEHGVALPNECTVQYNSN